MQKKENMPVLKESYQPTEEGIVLPDPFLEMTEQAIHCPVIVLHSDQLGQGEADLGKALLHEFLEALLEHPEPPESLLLYHKAAALLIDESEFIGELEALAKKGTEIFCCRTSLEHLTEKEPTVGIKITFADLLERIRQAKQVLWF